MGLIYANTLPILQEHARRPLGHVLFLGYPDVYFSGTALQALGQVRRRRGRRLADTPDALRPQYPSARAIMDSVGITFNALDASDYEGADIMFDLNAPETPAALCERWDVVVDHGTMEHVFHLPNLLANVFRMLKPGGRVIHNSPGNNFFDHGFYQFCPTFFADYYGANGWTIERQLIVQFYPEQETTPAFYAQYEPELFKALSYGGLQGKLYSNIVIATKGSEATHNVVPTQGYYSSRWK